MALQNKKILPGPAGELETQKEKAPASEQAVHFGQEKEKVVEKKEISQQDRIVSSELRREIEMMELDSSTKKEAEKEREEIEYLGEKEKIEHLLKIARKKGLVYAIQVAKKMNDAFILDTLHDALAKEGFYVKIAKQTDDDSSASSGPAKKT